MRPRRPGRALLPATRASLLVGLPLLAALALACLAAACGKKAAPRPPQLVIPVTPQPVRVAPVDQGLKVTWPRPRTYVDGAPLDDLGSFEVARACGDDTTFVPLAVLPVSDRERFRKGSSFSIVDPDVAPQAPCRYRVVAVTLDGYRSAAAESGLPGEPAPLPSASPSVSRAAAPAPSPVEPPLPAVLATPVPSAAAPPR